MKVRVRVRVRVRVTIGARARVRGGPAWPPPQGGGNKDGVARTSSVGR